MTGVTEETTLTGKAENSTNSAGKGIIDLNP
jgi:hypothetical protein